MKTFVKMAFYDRENSWVGDCLTLFAAPILNVIGSWRRYFSLGLPAVPVNRKSVAPKGTPERSPSPAAVQLRQGPGRSRRRKPGRTFYHTITDPCFPVFWDNGVALSRSLFDHYLNQHYQLLGSASEPRPEIRSERRPESLPAPAKPVNKTEVNFSEVNAGKYGTLNFSSCIVLLTCATIGLILFYLYLFLFVLLNHITKTVDTPTALVSLTEDRCCTPLGCLPAW